MNKDIKDRVFLLPDDIKVHLRFQLSNNNGNSIGEQRARNLLNDGSVTYGQLKKNYS